MKTVHKIIDPEYGEQFLMTLPSDPDGSTQALWGWFIRDFKAGNLVVYMASQPKFDPRDGQPLTLGSSILAECRE